ncbi:MAG: RluA family pseudouridine synthase, partial [Deltaproteobacteria bacterium]|nr:RluA family pseudouridine synthase [Deltaproteobacteria bacterium]
MTVRFTVDEDTAGEAGVRADHAVRARYPEVDRAFALRLLKDGRLRINGAQATLAARARAGSVVTIDAAANKLGPAVLPPGPACTVLWQGDGVVVVDKADGVAMHGAEGAGDGGAAEDGDGDGEDTLSALLLERFGVEDDMPGPSFPGRLDRPTSGLVVACLSRPSETALQAAWTRKDARGERDPVLKKEYLCIVHGRAPGEGDLEIPLAARRARGRGTGKVEDARTTFVTLAQSRRFSLLLCQLHTGRTHQIRRHMKAIGHPIVGDPRYGDARRDGDIRVDGAQGLMLHAWRLSHDGSVAALPATLTAPVPERFRALLRGTSLVVDDAVAAAARGERPSRAGDDDGDEAPASTSGGPAKAAPTSARPARPATERPAPTRGGPAKVAPTRGGPAKA